MSYVTPSSIHTDFSQRVVLDTQALAWHPSPQAGVERRFLDRVGDEVARATSLVRYAPGSRFPAHRHGGGEEFYVLAGTFSDEHGDYPVGTYVRNPPGSAHAPFTREGCVILVKLRQMKPEGEPAVVVDTNSIRWLTTEFSGLHYRPLFEAADHGERVVLEQLDPGAQLSARAHPGGEEIYIVQGAFSDDTTSYVVGTWIRNPPYFHQSMVSPSGCILWIKRGHLPPVSD